MAATVATRSSLAFSQGAIERPFVSREETETKAAQLKTFVPRGKHISCVAVLPLPCVHIRTYIAYYVLYEHKGGNPRAKKKSYVFHSSLREFFSYSYLFCSIYTHTLFSSLRIWRRDAASLKGVEREREGNPPLFSKELVCSTQMMGERKGGRGEVWAFSIRLICLCKLSLISLPFSPLFLLLHSSPS